MLVAPVADPPSVVLVPAQMVTSGPAFAVNGLTVTTTTSVPEHPPVVPVTVYDVVTAGVATGLAMFGLLNPAVGDHVYVVPPEAPNVALPLQLMETSKPAFTDGNVFTVTVTEAVAEHDPFPTVTVYVVVEVGLAVGFAMLVALNPVAGNQL